MDKPLRLLRARSDNLHAQRELKHGMRASKLVGHAYLRGLEVFLRFT